MLVVLEGKGHFLFFSFLRTLWELVVDWPLDDGACFCEGLFIEVTGFLDSLYFAGIVSKAEFVSWASRLEKHVLFDNG